MIALLTGMQRLALLLAALVLLLSGFYMAAVGKGKAQAVATQKAEQVEVLKDEVKRNKKAAQIDEAARRGAGAANFEWMCSNGFIREDGVQLVRPLQADLYECARY